MDEKIREIRNTLHEVVIIEEAESRRVEGYALLFDTKSDGLKIEEIVERGSLDGVIEKSNIFALLNHDDKRGILARSKKGKGTLTLTVDTKGLKYSFDAPKTALGDELLEYIRRGEITESSFSFMVAEDLWEKKNDGTWKRTIKKFDEIFDVSPVYDAAYSKTSVSLRGKEQAEKEMAEIEKRELENYYSEIDKMFN